MITTGRREKFPPNVHRNSRCPSLYHTSSGCVLHTDVTCHNISENDCHSHLYACIVVVCFFGLVLHPAVIENIADGNRFPINCFWGFPGAKFCDCVDLSFWFTSFFGIAFSAQDATRYKRRNK